MKSEREDDRNVVSGEEVKEVKKQKQSNRDCPYLDSVNRNVLDFDFEKLCCVSLSNLNVYACLVCGKFYQGKNQKSHAYTHSLETEHHVYINLATEKVYCLPDGYEIKDNTCLDDIKHVLNPRFSNQQLEVLDSSKNWSKALDGSFYIPGMVGLNNLQKTEFVNVTVQSLMRVAPLRNFFLVSENYQDCKSPLVQRFGELTRKIWNDRNFKGHVSPREFLQAVMKASKKRFKIGQESDPVEFMSWLLNTLHVDLRSKNGGGSIIHECFQGELEVEKESADSKTSFKMPFLMLGLDLPPAPLFQDVIEKNLIPQINLFDLLKKFDGETVTEVVGSCVVKMRYRVTKLPRYLMFHMARFKKNSFFVEKNPTLVNFRLKNMELRDYIPLPNEVRSRYNLIANIVHEGKPQDGVFRVFVQRRAEELWYEMHLRVAETLSQLVELSEAYMQVYELQEE